MKQKPAISASPAACRPAWMLYAVGIVISGWHILGDAIAFSGECERGGVEPFRFAGILFFVLALYSNVVFVFALSLCNTRRPTTGWKILLIGSIAVNSSLLLFLPRFALEPGYWPWLLAFPWLLKSLLSFSPATATSRQRAEPLAVETVNASTDYALGLLWAWLGVTSFWLGVAWFNHVHPENQLRSSPAQVAASALKLTSYVLDPSNALTGVDQERLNQKLGAFEKETSNQIAVAIYASAPSEDIDDFTIRTAERWHVGRSGRDNGAVMFLFLKERIVRMEVGYGLEGALPDGAVEGILSAELAPLVAQGRLSEGLDQSLNAILLRVRSEYGPSRGPGPLAVAFARLRSVFTKFGPQIWPFLRHTSAGERIPLTFMVSMLALGIGNSFVATGRVFANVALMFRNLIRRRPMRSGLMEADLGSVFDTLKLVALLAIPIAGIVVLVAGGGAFGGGGARVHW